MRTLMSHLFCGIGRSFGTVQLVLNRYEIKNACKVLVPPTHSATQPSTQHHPLVQWIPLALASSQHGQSWPWFCLGLTTVWSWSHYPSGLVTLPFSPSSPLVVVHVLTSLPSGLCGVFIWAVPLSQFEFVSILAVVILQNITTQMTRSFDVDFQSTRRFHKWWKVHSHMISLPRPAIFAHSLWLYFYLLIYFCQLDWAHLCHLLTLSLCIAWLDMRPRFVIEDCELWLWSICFHYGIAKWN